MREFFPIRLQPGPARDQVTAFLASFSLKLEDGLDLMLVCRDGDGRILACGGLARDVLKCLAIAPECRGEGMALSLVTALRDAAWDRGSRDLFLYTKPENEALFRDCAFRTLALVPEAAVLMENSPDRLARYQESLSKSRVSGREIASLVMNCNPFTLGHRHLVEEAVARSDAVHLFLVREEASEVPFADRLELVRRGTAHLNTVRVHPGSEYILSRATFPQYFLKDKADVDRAFTGIDLQIFRRHIAPVLGITFRLAGEEPVSGVTRRYNQDMAFWLETDKVPAPPVRFMEIPRLEVDAEPVSASRVRRLWRQGDLESCARLVPPTTLAWLQDHRQNV